MTIKDQIIYAMGEGREKAVHVPQNEAVTFFTRDCFNNQINSEEYVVDRLDWDHINPATGPVYVEGAAALSWRTRGPCAASRATGCWVRILRRVV